jgi:hypothetical protein
MRRSAIESLFGIAAACVLCLSGCATVVKGSSQPVTLETKPPGATCVLTRKSKTVAVVNPTPGTVTVDKSKDAMAVSCTKDGYEEAAGVVKSEFQPMTFGNIILGGLIGVAVDAASGAMTEYQPSVTITLIPNRFETAQERDAFFDRMHNEFLVQARQVEQRINKVCGDAANCNRQLQAAKKAEEAQLAEIEKKRLLAKVEPANRLSKN